MATSHSDPSRQRLPSVVQSVHEHRVHGAVAAYYFADPAADLTPTLRQELRRVVAGVATGP